MGFCITIILIFNGLASLKKFQMIRLKRFGYQKVKEHLYVHTYYIIPSILLPSQSEDE